MGANNGAGKTKAQTISRFRTARIGAVKSAKDGLSQFRWNSRTRVLNGNTDEPSILATGDAYFTASWRVFDGVIHQMGQGALDSGRLPDCRGASRGQQGKV